MNAKNDVNVGRRRKFNKRSCGFKKCHEKTLKKPVNYVDFYGFYDARVAS